MFDVMYFGQFHRLEPAVRPSSTGGQLDDALAARVADPLFLLARQWQMAEFAGEDGGTPVWCRISTETTPLSSFRPSGDDAAAVRLPEGVPLEYLAEAGATPAEATRQIPLRTAAHAGQRFLTTLRTVGLPASLLDDIDAKVLAKAPLPEAPADPEKDPLRRDPAGRALRDVLATRAPDGVTLATALADGWRPSGLTAAARTAFEKAAAAWLDWFGQRHGPLAPSSWARERLEHRFAVTAEIAGHPVTLDAPEYTGGAADAHHFDLDTGDTPLPAPEANRPRACCPPASPIPACRPNAGGNSRTPPSTFPTSARASPTWPGC
ncbi:hypothetical protein ACFQ0G_38200 [Streptomyces chiangmaiensis]